jgi:peptidoglycan/LPS O-acetylase OafA/YrhL
MPALIFCALITSLAKHLLPTLVGPGREISWHETLEAIVGLPMLNVLHVHYRWPDGAYWSLDVEFRFYAACAAITLLGFRRHLVLARRRSKSRIDRFGDGGRD